MSKLEVFPSDHVGVFAIISSVLPGAQRLDTHHLRVDLRCELFLGSPESAHFRRIDFELFRWNVHLRVLLLNLVLIVVLHGASVPADHCSLMMLLDLSGDSVFVLLLLLDMHHSLQICLLDLHLQLASLGSLLSRHFDVKIFQVFVLLDFSITR